MRGAAWAWLFLIVVAGADATPAQAQAAGPAAPVMARHGIVASQEARAIGVAGTVAGLALAHAQYGSGKLSRADLMAPAIALARDGFAVDGDLADTLPRSQPRLVRWPASAKIFLKPDGVALGPGETLIQGDLAASLEAIARDGPRAFYEGAIAEKIAASAREA